MYTAHSSLGKGNVLLRHSVPNFSPNSRGTQCLVSGGTQRRVLPGYQRERDENIKYLISSSGDRAHNQSGLQSHSPAPGLRLDLIYLE